FARVGLLPSALSWPASNQLRLKCVPRQAMQRSPTLLPILLIAGAVGSGAQSPSATVQQAQPDPTPSEIQAPRPPSSIPDLSPVVSDIIVPTDNSTTTTVPRNPLPSEIQAARPAALIPDLSPV